MDGPIAVVGAGGQGRETASLLVECEIAGRGLGPLAGFIDDDLALVGALVGGLPVLGSIREIPSNIQQLVLGVGYPELKWRVVQRLRNLPLQWPSAVHPCSSIGRRAVIARGSFIQAGTVLTTDVHVGEFVTVNIGAMVSHDCVLGDFATISPRAALAGRVIVGEGAFVGIGASIHQGVCVGAWSVIGAGAVVIRDVEPQTVVVGVPARVIARRAEGWWRHA